MDWNLERHYFDLIEHIASIRAKEFEIKRLDEKMSHLRAIYTKNKEQIREIEAKKLVARALRKSHEIEKFSAILEILRARESEIAYEGKTYKAEKDSLLEEVAELPKMEKYLTETEAKLKAVVRKGSSCNVGSKFLRVAEFFFSSKTCNEVFYPMIGDWREDYLIALTKGRIFDVIFISAKNYISFIQTMIICSKFGKLIEFIMKLADVIEFFNKFSK